ncbi:unnamed protein product, partial [Rotaria sp. Silwood2]
MTIFPYEAQQDDELRFPADAILEILHEANTSGWFKARFGNQVGLISSTYVQPIDTHNPSIRELIETEQRYINDLRIVANEFIKPLSNGRILNDYEIEQLFSNWFSLIACNSVFLSTLQEQLQYKEHIVTSNIDVSIRTLRSTSMSKIATIAQVSINGIEHIHRSPSANNLTVICPISIERLDDNIVPQSSQLSSTMTINESTRIGEILCSHLPYMADTYFQYCNCHSQADKYLQSKVDLNEQSRSHLNIFQNKTGGLSLHDENSTDGYIFDELLKLNSITKFDKQRQLLLHGFLMKVSSGKELLAFLFNDFLLFSTIKTSSNN